MISVICAANIFDAISFSVSAAESPAASTIVDVTDFDILSVRLSGRFIRSLIAPTFSSILSMYVVMPDSISSLSSLP